MTLTEFNAVRLWHLQHAGHPLEKSLWEAVLTLWLMGCVGAPAALLLDIGWALAGGIALLFLPGAYVAWREWLHRRGRLRCDWLGAVSRR